MSDGSLSQDEIDALLQGGVSPDFSSDMDSSELSEDEKKAFLDLIRSTSGAQSSNLSGLTGEKQVRIGVPKLDVVSTDEFTGSLTEEVVYVNIPFSEGFSGSHMYVLSTELATKLAGLIVGQEQVELDDMTLEALKESFSTITGVILTAIGDRTGKTIMPSTGESERTSKDSIPLPPEPFVKLTYPLNIEGETPEQIHEILELSIVKEIASNLVQTTGQARQQSKGTQQPAAGAPGMGPQSQPTQQQGFSPQQSPPLFGQGQAPPNVQSVQFPQFNQQQQISAEQGNISLLMDVFMELTVELGRTKKPIREILGMGEGTIIELDKLAGEPVDILVNHKLIAKGEVVVIDENFGVRVTEIVSPME
ncbi:MAG: hypothetical protein DRP87_15615, partial [Spirochaetes bacterium]